MTNSWIEMVKRSIGQSLEDVEGLFYVPSDESDVSMENLTELHVTLSSCNFRFRCSNDGETMTIDGSELSASNLGEYGEMRKVSLALNPKFIYLAHARITRVFLVKSCGEQYVIGVGLEFLAGLLIICNWGDELKIWDRAPETLFSDEGIRIVPA